MNWIKSKDKLPDNVDDVLIHYCPNGWLSQSMIGFRENNKWFNDEGIEINDQEQVTHWMPIPKPPK